MDFAMLVNAVVLGIVQGITEFLPVSSTGHLILCNLWFGFSDKNFADLFDVVIQAGSVLAVILYFWRRLFPIFSWQTPDERRGIYELWLKAGLGFLPAAALGMALKDPVQQYLYFPVPVSIALVIWGIAIIAIERRKAVAVRFPTASDLPLGIALAIGLIQCLALVPGTSRSAATICGALLLGASRVAAAEFSFFLAIPTILGAGVYSLLGTHIKLGASQMVSLGTGFAVAFFVSLAVVAFLMKFIAKHSFEPFGWYRIAIGLVVLASAAAY
jgi:undecaprenyl-diphosphatase